MTHSSTDARAQTHVCLISQQATPNLTPLLDPGFAPKRVVMVVSAEMRARAGWLGDVLKARGVATETLEVADPWNLDALTDQLVDWLYEQGDDASVALNVTGGTKPMAMAAQQAFMVAQKPVFYVHQQRDEVMWLSPRRPARPLVNGLKLADYLNAHGWQVLDRPPLPTPHPSLRTLTAELVLNVGTMASALGVLNRCAHDCQERGQIHIRLDPRDLDNVSFISLVQKFEGAGACRLQDGALRFPDEASRFFCNGGWLEHHVAGVVGSLRERAGIQDLAINLKVRSKANRLVGEGGSNELDIAFLAHNRLHIIECKTRSFQDRNSAAEAVYKLDALTALGGLNTRAMLVSYRELIAGDRQRARDLNIHTTVGTALRNLEQDVLRWVGTVS